MSDEPDYEKSEENTPRLGLLSFPDPAARPITYKMLPDYAYTRGAARSRTHGPAIFDTSFTVSIALCKKIIKLLIKNISIDYMGIPTK